MVPSYRSFCSVVIGTHQGRALPVLKDGKRLFVSAGTTAGAIGVLAIFGLRPDRPGFGAVGLEGRADMEDAAANEIEVAAVRGDGSAPFGPMLAGGSAAGLYCVANAGELQLLTCRVLALLPHDRATIALPDPAASLEHVVQVD